MIWWHSWRHNVRQGRGPRIHEGAGLPQGPITIERDPPA